MVTVAPGPSAKRSVPRHDPTAVRRAIVSSLDYVSRNFVWAPEEGQ